MSKRKKDINLDTTFSLREFAELAAAQENTFKAASIGYVASLLGGEPAGKLVLETELLMRDSKRKAS